MVVYSIHQTMERLCWLKIEENKSNKSEANSYLDSDSDECIEVSTLVINRKRDGMALFLTYFQKVRV